MITMILISDDLDNHYGHEGDDKQKEHDLDFNDVDDLKDDLDNHVGYKSDNPVARHIFFRSV